MPPSMGELQKEALVAAYTIYSKDKEFETAAVARKLYGENATPKMRYHVSGFFSNFKLKGYVSKLESGLWVMTDHGIYVVNHISEVTIRKDTGPKKPPHKKIPLKDIKPIERPFTANLSGSAAMLAGSIGAVLDENQSYRDFLKMQLQQIADFLNVKVIYQEDETNVSNNESE